MDRVRDVVNEAEELFQQAIDTAPAVQAFVSKAYEARLDALEAEAKDRSPELWVEAELQFYEATSRAEKGRERRVQDYAEKAEALYRDAELAAIENVLFARIDAEIKQALIPKLKTFSFIRRKCCLLSSRAFLPTTAIAG